MISSSYVENYAGSRTPWAAVSAVLVCGALAAPGAAFAHGIHAGSSDSVPDFVRIGFLHMLTGYDHLLFAGGVVLLAGQIRRAPKLISLFVAGHSLTLLIATLAGWRVNPAAVDVVIALSVAWVGLACCRVGRSAGAPPAPPSSASASCTASASPLDFKIFSYPAATPSSPGSSPSTSGWSSVSGLNRK